MSVDYRSDLAEAIRTHIYDNDYKYTFGTLYEESDDATDADALAQWLSDELWNCDDVTGNGCGSYYCNSAAAREMVLANIEDVAAAYLEYCNADKFGRDIIGGNWEYMDVIARCYYLGAACDDIAEEFIQYVDDNRAALIASGAIVDDGESA